MNENWLDKELNEKLSDYGSPMNLEAAWDKLEARRAPKKKKRGLWIFWTLGICFIGFASYMFLDSTDEEAAEVEKIAFNLDNVTESRMVSDEDQDIESVLYPEVRTETARAEDPKLSTKDSKETPSINELEVAFNARSTSSKLDILSEGVRIPLSAAIIDEKTKGVITAVSQAALLTALEDPNNDISFEQNDSSILSSRVGEDVRSIASVQNISSLVLTDLSAKETNYSFKPIITVTSQSTLSDAEKTTLNSSSRLGFAAGYSLLSNGKVLSDESALDVVTTNLYYQKYMGKNWYLKTGLNIDQYTTILDSDVPAIYRVEKRDDQVIVVNSYQNGLVEKIEGSADVQIKETASYTIFNRYQFVSVPLIAGARFSTSSRSDLEVEGGLSAMIVGSYNVKDIYTDTSIAIRQVENLELKKRGLFNALYGAQWNYYPTRAKRMAYFVKYQGQIQLNSMTKSSQLNTQNFGSHQFMIGLSYGLK